MYVHLGLSTSSQAEISNFDRDPTLQFATNVQTAPDLHNPTVIKLYLAVMEPAKTRSFFSKSSFARYIISS